MPAPAPAPDDVPAPRWSLAEALVAAGAAFVVATILQGLVLAGAGVSGDEVDDISLRLLAVLQATLWVGMVGAVALVVVRRGGTLVEDLGLRVRGLDVPLGLALGVACQLILVPVVSAPWVRILGEDTDAISEPACRLAEKADDGIGVVLLALITVVGAPVVEELFFRGFLQRAAIARLGRPAGLVVTAVAFGLTHFQLLQLPALIFFGLVLGLLADRTGRLGPSILTHMAFNATTVVGLLVLSNADCDAVLGLVLR